MQTKILFFALLIIGMSACKNEPTSSFKPLDLMSYGVPIKILAPEETTVKTDDLIVMQEVSIRGGEDYFVQIRYSDANTSDLAMIKAEEIADAKKNPFFSEIIKEENDGFMYKTQIDSTRTGYGFRYIKLQGDKEYRFRNGIVGIFSKEATEAMYESVKNGK